MTFIYIILCMPVCLPVIVCACVSDIPGGGAVKRMTAVTCNCLHVPKMLPVSLHYFNIKYDFSSITFYIIDS